MDVIIRIISPIQDKLAEEMYERFTVEGYCPFGTDGLTMGFIADAKKSLEGYILKVEVVDTSTFEYMKELEKMLEK
jgi:hypothetical protein